ncbi:MAG: divalent-cation tolerance protein CutA [Myxococcaceae bacterium]|nr:divalent-cation tolerance protein CutA [Myxococcaceae bacterium]
MSDAIVVLVTVPDGKKAASIARTLVEERLAACGNIIPGLRSIYRWEGKICDDPEVLLILKSRAERFEALRARIVELHPYQVPEVLRLDVADGHVPYLKWIAESMGGAESA